MKEDIEVEINSLNEGIKHIRLLGRLDMKNVLLIDSRFTAAVLTGETRVLVDLAGVDFLASLGIRLLVANAKALSERGGLMVLAQAHALTLKTLQVSGVDSFIPLFDQLEEAIAHLQKA